MEAYERAISDGSDFLGIDVVSTKDGVLICRPDITLDDSTNVASLPQFAGRKSVQAGALCCLQTPSVHSVQTLWRACRQVSWLAVRRASFCCWVTSLTDGLIGRIHEPQRNAARVCQSSQHAL